MSKKTKAPTKPVRSVSDHVVCGDIMQTFEYEGNFLPVRTFIDKISDISDLRHPPQEGVEYGIRVDYPGHDGGYELQLVRRVTESDQSFNARLARHEEEVNQFTSEDRDKRYKMFLELQKEFGKGTSSSS